MFDVCCVSCWCFVFGGLALADILLVCGVCCLLLVVRCVSSIVCRFFVFVVRCLMSVVDRLSLAG